MKYTLFEQLKFEPAKDIPLSRAHLEFDNGYTASVITGEYAYSDILHPYEFAIMRDGEVCYDTSITDDVVGYCTENDIESLLQKTRDLPKLEVSK